MIVICPITKKRYERFDFGAYHDEDCPYCKLNDSTKKMKNL